jgi:hypothetical protein
MDKWAGHGPTNEELVNDALDMFLQGALKEMALKDPPDDFPAMMSRAADALTQEFGTRLGTHSTKLVEGLEMWATAYLDALKKDA